MTAKVPPDTVFFVCAGLSWLIAKVFPQFAFTFPGENLLFWLLSLAGFALTIAANISLFRHNTTSRPNKNALPSAARLVNTGVYQYSRNPVYLGMILLLLAWLIFLRNWLSAAGPIIFLVFITRYQILPEEKSLANKFGDAYSRYKEKVRRWI